MRGFLINPWKAHRAFCIEPPRLLIYEAWKSAKSRKYVIEVILSGTTDNIRLYLEVINMFEEDT